MNREEEILRSAALLLNDDDVEGDLRASSEALADGMDESVWREAAVLLLMDAARYRWRSRNLQRERQAQKVFLEKEAKKRANQQSEQEAERKATRGYGHGSFNKRNPCWCEICTKAKGEAEAIDHKINERTNQYMMDAISKFTAEIRMEWTQELLNSGFALPDGSICTWRDATISDHKTRFDMLKRNAEANAEAAARHQSAINTIAACGAKTLGEAVSEVKAA